jgi:hypothetical protein
MDNSIYFDKKYKGSLEGVNDLYNADVTSLYQ